MKQVRIGVYAGVFDPVHSGHISFALQTLEQADLGGVYFLPERKPFRKPGAEHYGHRVAMLRQAIKPHKDLSVLELVDRQFTVKRTVRQLQQAFPDSQLVFLTGADMFTQMPEWQHIDWLVRKAEFIVAADTKDELRAVLTTIQVLRIPPRFIRIVDNLCPGVSSTKMRHAIRHNAYTDGLLTSVVRYAKKEWLYASIR